MVQHGHPGEHLEPSKAKKKMDVIFQQLTSFHGQTSLALDTFARFESTAPQLPAAVPLIHSASASIHLLCRHRRWRGCSPE